MEHELFFDGNLKEYSWSIKTGKEVVTQIREHPPPYISGYKLDIKNDDESKFVALHVGIYWSLGVFIIKNGDTLNVMCDSKKMYDILRTKCKTPDEIINSKIKFINDLLERRKLVVNYHLIDSNKNPASDLIR